MVENRCDLAGLEVLTIEDVPRLREEARELRRKAGDLDRSADRVVFAERMGWLSFNRAALWRDDPKVVVKMKGG